MRSRDRLFGTRLGFGLDDTEFESRQEKEISVFPITSRQALRSTELPIDMFRVSFQKAKQSGREVYYWPPPSVQVKNEWSYTSTSPVCINDVDRETLLLLPLIIWRQIDSKQNGNSVFLTLGGEKYKLRNSWLCKFPHYPNSLCSTCRVLPSHNWWVIRHFIFRCEVILNNSNTVS